MNILPFLSAVSAPGDLWTIMINWVNNSVGNFGWAILLATIIVKLIMSPLDVWVKYNSKKQMLVQQKLAPQIAKLQKKFGNDQQSLKVQQQALYKREGMNMGIGCIVMLVQMVLTMVVFFTFYSSLRSVSAYKAIDEYEYLEQTYFDAYYSNLDSYLSENNIVLLPDSEGNIETKEEFYNNYKNNYIYYENNKNNENLTAEETQKLEDAKNYIESYDNLFANEDYSSFAEIDEMLSIKPSKIMLEKWNSIKSSWLWIDNIWVADATTSPFPSYNSLKSIAKNGGYSAYVEEYIDENQYTSIASYIEKHSSRTQNGYYILAISAGVLTFLSQWIAELHNKLKNKKAKLIVKNSNPANTGSAMKIMKFVMPVIMVLFVISTGASFGIYILASNLSSLLFGEITTLIVDVLTKKKRLEVEAELEKEANRLIKKGKLQG